MTFYVSTGVVVEAIEADDKRSAAIRWAAKYTKLSTPHPVGIVLAVSSTPNFSRDPEVHLWTPSEVMRMAGFARHAEELDRQLAILPTGAA